MKSFGDVNEGIELGSAVMLASKEAIDLVREKWIKSATEEVDVVATGTLGAIFSSGAFLNFGHSLGEV